jgi:hypothetical protein
MADSRHNDLARESLSRDNSHAAPNEHPLANTSQRSIAPSTNSEKSSSRLQKEEQIGNQQNDLAIDPIKADQGQAGQDEQADKMNGDVSDNVNPLYQVDDRPYSAFSHNEKKITIICAGLCAFFSPISGQIYFPSLTVIASDLKVSDTLVNLTITIYLVSDISYFIFAVKIKFTNL